MLSKGDFGAMARKTSWQQSAMRSFVPKVRLGPFPPCCHIGAKEVGIARAHNLLSSAEYILYTTWYSSLTLGELGVVRLGGLCESKMWERTRDVLFILHGYMGFIYILRARYRHSYTA